MPISAGSTSRWTVLVRRATSLGAVTAGRPPGPGDDEQDGGVEGRLAVEVPKAPIIPRFMGWPEGSSPRPIMVVTTGMPGALAQGQQLLLGPRAEQAAAHAQEGAVGGGDGGTPF